MGLHLGCLVADEIEYFGWQLCNAVQQFELILLLILAIIIDLARLTITQSVLELHIHVVF